MPARHRLAPLSLLLAGASPAAALAQNQAAPAQDQATPPVANQAVPIQTIPGLDNYSLPASKPSPTPTPAPEPTIGPMIRSTPAPTPAPPSRVVAQPAPAPATPGPTPTPTSRPTSAPPAVSNTPSPATTPTPPITGAVPPPILGLSPLGSGEEGSSWPWIALGAAVLAAGVAAWWLLRRRPRDDVPPAAVPTPPPPAPEPVFVAPPPPARRPRLELLFRPRRAGTTITGTAVDYEVTARNVGDAAATDIRLALGLLTAHAGQDEELARLFGAPIERPAAPPFGLEPGDSVVLEGMALLSFDQLKLLQIGSVKAFVPVIALSARYRWGEIGEGQDAASWLIGLERRPGEKLAPFRLDQGPRMWTEVAARLHSAKVAR